MSDLKFTIEEYITKVQNADFETLVKLQAPSFEPFKEYESIGESECNLIYDTWYDRLSEFEPLSHEQIVALIPYDDIDERLIPIIKRLNDLRLYTKHCCQGVDVSTYTAYTNYNDQHPSADIFYPNSDLIEAYPGYPNGSPHSRYAYVDFDYFIPHDLADLIESGSDKLRIEKNRLRVESTKTKYNSEFHIDLGRILDEWIESLDY